MRRVAASIALIAALTLSAIAGIWWVASRPVPSPDPAELNDVLELTKDSWPAIPTNFEQTLTIVASTGQVLYSNSSEPITDPLQAVRRHAISGPLVVEGSIVATVYVHVDLTAEQMASRQQIAVIATSAIGGAGLLTALLILRTYRRIVRPFDRLGDFATQVASGDLDAPLEMDPGNTFGAWSESFDLMRSELAASRQREEVAKESKQQLVAQISHDIRTPVSSIAATAELMKLTADQESSDNLEIISNKAAQLEALVTDLFQANEAQIAALEVAPTEFASTEIGTLIEGADYLRRADVGPIPECLIKADRRRLAQVIDNIMANAYKHAGTPIRVTATTVGNTLTVAFADRGPGVPESELGTIFARGVRGSNVGDVPGHGLGLFTCAKLMERMDGDIGAHLDDGLTITLTIPLA